MEPASKIIELLGGLSSASSEVGLSVHTVKRWRQPKELGGTDGFIPRSQQFTVHASLLSKGIEISTEEIVYSPDQRAELETLHLSNSQATDAGSETELPAPVSSESSGEVPNIGTQT